MESCCAGSPKELTLLAKPVAVESMPVQSSNGTLEFITIPAGSFLMGSEDEDANPLDAEGPIREVSVAEFEISSTPVTNAQFAEFVGTTGYKTEAELSGWSFVFQSLVAKGAEVIGQSENAPWWLGVRGANWKDC
jgi:sulfatase modifying factor 1